MPLISIANVTLTLVTNPNVVAGDRFEFPPAGKFTTIVGGIVSDVADVLATFSVGDRVIVENYVVPIESAVGVVAVDRDFNFRAVAKPGERIIVSITNNNAATATTALLLNLN